MKILLTGATGFIGQKLVCYLLEQTDATLQLAIRKSSGIQPFKKISNHRLSFTQVGDITSSTNWQTPLIDCQVVIHAAARVHIMDEQAHDPLTAFREINVEGTLNLAKQAAKMGVKRFIYLSSIKVNGEYTQQGSPFGPDDIACPEHPYSISKHEAEQGLMALAEKFPMEVIIIRPPLVYGPGVKGNFFRMMQFLEKGIPLPLGALKKNKRSYVSVENLVHLISTCIHHPDAGNQIFLVSDGDDLSTADLLQKIRQLFGKNIPLLPLPFWILNSAAIVFGKKEEMKRLYGSLQVDISKSIKLLDWQPIETVDDALYKTVQAYRVSLVED